MIRRPPRSTPFPSTTLFRPAPFVVPTHDPPPLLAADFGVPVHPRAPAFAFPSLGAYVGGDIVAGMLATRLTRDKRLRLFIDGGTNSEIALGNQDRVVATAAPRSEEQTSELQERQ